MKRLFGACGLLAFPFLFMLQVSTTSCTKETIYDTVTVIKKDTVILKDTTLTTTILTANSWKIQELRGVLGGNNIYYVRGGNTNTQSFDNEYITFSQNNTGVVMQNNGTQNQSTWTFLNEEHTKLSFTLLNTPATYTVTWENIRYKNKRLEYDQYFTDGNLHVNEHSHQIRIPK